MKTALSLLGVALASLDRTASTPDRASNPFEGKKKQMPAKPPERSQWSLQLHVRCSPR
jgi:hypothetical protein